MNQVIVGNIGTVYSGSNNKEAARVYKEYISQSKSNYGRAGGEDVTWMKNGEPHKEFTGTLHQN